MKKRNPKIFLNDILQSIKHIEEYIKEISYDNFIKDQKTVDAVIRNLEIIGEATKNISDVFKKKNPHLPWKEMAKMRDKLIHGYFDIIYQIVWKTINSDLPQIKHEILKIFENK